MHQVVSTARPGPEGVTTFGPVHEAGPKICEKSAENLHFAQKKNCQKCKQMAGRNHLALFGGGPGAPGSDPLGGSGGKRHCLGGPEGGPTHVPLCRIPGCVRVQHI